MLVLYVAFLRDTLSEPLKQTFGTSLTEVTATFAPSAALTHAGDAFSQLAATLSCFAPLFSSAGSNLLWKLLPTSEVMMLIMLVHHSAGHITLELQRDAQHAQLRTAITAMLAQHDANAPGSLGKNLYTASIEACTTLAPQLPFATDWDSTPHLRRVLQHLDALCEFVNERLEGTAQLVGHLTAKQLSGVPLAKAQFSNKNQISLLFTHDSLWTNVQVLTPAWLTIHERRVLQQQQQQQQPPRGTLGSTISTPQTHSQNTMAQSLPIQAPAPPEVPADLMPALSKYLYYLYTTGNSVTYAFPEAQVQAGSLQHLLEWVQRLERLNDMFSGVTDHQIIACTTTGWNRHLPYFVGWDDKVQALKQANLPVTLSTFYEYVAPLVAPHAAALVPSKSGLAYSTKP